MRILVVMNLFPPHSFGGYEDLCAGAVASWRDAGHDVRVLTSRFTRPDVEPVDHEVGVARVLPLAWDDHELVVPPLRQQREDQLAAKAAVEQQLADLRPDVVSVWNPAALPLAGLFTAVEASGVPVALVVGDRWLLWGPDSDPWSARLRRHPWRRLGRTVGRLAGAPTPPDRLATRVVALFASSYLRADAEGREGWPVDDAAVVPHGPDLDRYPPVDPETADRPWRGRLLYVGRLASEKGVDTAVRALALLPGAQLDVHGTGPDDHIGELHRLADDLGVRDRIAFHGEAGPDELRAAYDAADALVFPSSWPEPFGIVPLEAMARGLPVVATGTGGSGEFLVDGRTALRFDRGDHAGLAARVRELAGDPALRQRLRTEGVAVARWLSRGRVNDELLRWHLHLAGRAPRPDERPVLPPGQPPDPR